MYLPILRPLLLLTLFMFQVALPLYVELKSTCVPSTNPQGGAAGVPVGTGRAGIRVETGRPCLPLDLSTLSTRGSGVDSGQPALLMSADDLFDSVHWLECVSLDMLSKTERRALGYLKTAERQHGAGDQREAIISLRKANYILKTGTEDAPKKFPITYHDSSYAKYKEAISGGCPRDPYVQAEMANIAQIEEAHMKDVEAAEKAQRVAAATVAEKQRLEKIARSDQAVSAFTVAHQQANDFLTGSLESPAISSGGAGAASMAAPISDTPVGDAFAQNERCFYESFAKTFSVVRASAQNPSLPEAQRAKACALQQQLEEKLVDHVKTLLPGWSAVAVKVSWVEDLPAGGLSREFKGSLLDINGACDVLAGKASVLQAVAVSIKAVKDYNQSTPADRRVIEPLVVQLSGVENALQGKILIGVANFVAKYPVQRLPVPVLQKIEPVLKWALEHRANFSSLFFRSADRTQDFWQQLGRYDNGVQKLLDRATTPAPAPVAKKTPPPGEPATAKPLDHPVDKDSSRVLETDKEKERKALEDKAKADAERKAKEAARRAERSKRWKAKQKAKEEAKQKTVIGGQASGHTESEGQPPSKKRCLWDRCKEKIVEFGSAVADKVVAAGSAVVDVGSAVLHGVGAVAETVGPPLLKSTGEVVLRTAVKDMFAGPEVTYYHSPCDAWRSPCDDFRSPCSAWHSPCDDFHSPCDGRPMSFHRPDSGFQFPSEGPYQGPPFGFTAPCPGSSFPGVDPSASTVRPFDSDASVASSAMPIGESLGEGSLLVSADSMHPVVVAGDVAMSDGSAAVTVAESVGMDSKLLFDALGRRTPLAEIFDRMGTNTQKLVAAYGSAQPTVVCNQTIITNLNELSLQYDRLGQTDQARAFADLSMTVYQANATIARAVEHFKAVSSGIVTSSMQLAADMTDNTVKTTVALSRAMLMLCSGDHEILADKYKALLEATASRVGTMTEAELFAESFNLVSCFVATSGGGLRLVENIKAATLVQVEVVKALSPRNAARMAPMVKALQGFPKVVGVAAKEGPAATAKALTVVGENPQLVTGGESFAGAVAAVARLEKEIILVEQTAQQAALTGLRKVTFFNGLQHAKINHFFGNTSRSLKVLDPGGTTEKWLGHIVELAQHGLGDIKSFPEGDFIEIMGKMSKTDGTGMLDVGIRMFKKNGSDVWELTTLLTKQMQRGI